MITWSQVRVLQENSQTQRIAKSVLTASRFFHDRLRRWVGRASTDLRSFQGTSTTRITAFKRLLSESPEKERLLRNPSRRSKKIGLTQGGRVRNGRAGEKWSRRFPRNLYATMSNIGRSGACRIIAENPSHGFYHPCTAEEVLGVLGRLPEHLSRPVRAVIMRRSSKRDLRLGIEAARRYSVVILNAFPVSNEIRWRRPMVEAQRRHDARWCSTWVEDGEHVRACWRDEEVKRYYLYHLLLHEVGHINQPPFHRLKQRESFAENFALEWASKLGELPPSVEP